MMWPIREKCYEALFNIWGKHFMKVVSAEFFIKEEMIYAAD